MDAARSISPRVSFARHLLSVSCLGACVAMLASVGPDRITPSSVTTIWYFGCMFVSFCLVFCLWPVYVLWTRKKLSRTLDEDFLVCTIETASVGNAMET